MAINFEALAGKLGIDTAAWTTGLARAQSDLQRFAAAGRQSFEAIKRGAENVARGFAALSTAAAAGIGGLVKLASDAEEAGSKFGFVFGNAADSTRRKLDEFAKAAGRSKYELRNMAADVGALIGPLGFTSEQTGKMSTQISKLATDLSSFFNVTEGDALTALRSGLIGETEPLRRFGVNLSQAKIDAEAFAMGLTKAKEAATGKAKALAIMNIVMRETSQAQGDAERTAGGFANTVRRVAGQFKDLAVDLGGPFKTALTVILNDIGLMFRSSDELTGSLKEWLQVHITAESTKAFWDGLKERMGEVWQAGQRLVERFQGLGGTFETVKAKAEPLLEGLQKLWGALPQWAQDLLLVGGAMFGISAGAGALGSQIPIVGGFFTAISSLLNPVGLLRGFFAVLAPLGSALLGVFAGLTSEFWLTVAAVGAVVGGVVLLIKNNETAHAAYERLKETIGSVWKALQDLVESGLKVAAEWWDKNHIQLERIGEKLWDVAGRVLGFLIEQVDHAVQGLMMMGQDALPYLQKAWELIQPAIQDAISWVEAFTEALTGDFRRAASLALKDIEFLIRSVKGLAESFPFIGKMVGSGADTALTAIGAMRAAIDASIAASDMDAEAKLKAAAAAREAFKQEKEAIEDVVAGMKAMVGESGVTDEALAQIGDAVASIDKDLLGLSTELEGATGKQASLLREKIDVLVKAKAQLIDLAAQQAEAVGESKSEAANAGGKELSQKDLADLAFGTGEATQANTTVQDIVKEMGGGGVAQGTGVAVGQGIAQGVQQPVVEAVKGTADAVKPVLKFLFDETAEMTQQEARKIIGQIQAQVNFQRKFTQDQLNEARNDGATTAQLGQLQQLRQAFLQTLEQMKGAQGEARVALAQQAEQIQKAFQGAFDNIENGGKKLFKGLVDNAKQAAGGVVDAAQQMANGFNQVLDKNARRRMADLQAGGEDASPLDLFLGGLQNAFSSVQGALGGIFDANAQFQQFLGQADPKSALDAQIAQVQAQLQQTEINKGTLNNNLIGQQSSAGFGSAYGGKSIDTYMKELNETLKSLQKQRAALDHAPRMAAGGIVTRPTWAMIGEAGPEAVIPLGRGAGVGTMTNHINISLPNARVTPDLAREIADALDSELKRRGHDATGRSPLSRPPARQPSNSRIR